MAGLGNSNVFEANESNTNDVIREEIEMVERVARAPEDATLMEAEAEERAEAHAKEEVIVMEAKDEVEPKKEVNSEIVEMKGGAKEELKKDKGGIIVEKGKMDKGKKVDDSYSNLVSIGQSSALAGSYDQNLKRYMPTELHKAATEGNIHIINNYREASSGEWKFVTPTGNSILHIHVAVPVHVRTVSNRFLEYILSTSNIPLGEVTNDRDETPLHLAANFGQLTAVLLFLQKDLSLLYMANVDGDTALHLAIRSKHIDIVRALLAVASPPLDYSRYTTDAAGESPTYVAVQTGSEEMLNYMLFQALKASPHGSELTGTILHAAVLWGTSGMVTSINNKCPELIEYKDAHGQTPLHYAAGIDNGMLRLLLKRQSSTTAPYTRDTEGRTPAHIAAQLNNVYGLKLLMDYFPDSFEITDNQGRNIVHYAAFLGRIEALDYFVKDARFSDFVNKKDYDGNTPLHLLASSLTELPIARLRPIQSLIPKLKALQLKTYNKQNLTPGDIVNSFKIFELEPAYQEVVKDFREVAPKGGRVKNWLQPLNEHKVDIEVQRNKSATSLLRTAKTPMVVATLIATISFAAGLGVPGGFNQDATDKAKGGTAILSNRTSFRVFLISDCIALASSLTAILLYFWIAMGKGKGSSKTLFFWAFEASSVSIIAVMVAFMAGIYSILQPSNLVFAACAILILSVFIYFYCIFAMGVIQLREARKRLMGKDDPQKLKKEVLYGKVETHNPRSSFLKPSGVSFNSLQNTSSDASGVPVRADLVDFSGHEYL